MQNPQTGYKVLKKSDSKLYSCSLPDGLRMEYPVGEEVTPRAGWGPLALFPNEIDSYAFIAANNMTNCTVRECEYLLADFSKYKIIVDEEGTNRPARVLYMPRNEFQRCLSDANLWNRVCIGELVYTCAVPTTTIYADVVKVLARDEEVDHD
jgi:hypothetical protein